MKLSKHTNKQFIQHRNQTHESRHTTTPEPIRGHWRWA